MPGVRGFVLPQLRKALISYAEKTGRRPSLEYALIEGVNDSPAQLDALVAFCRGMLVHVNLIAMNPVAESGLGRPPAERIRQFERGLRHAGIEVSIRTERGTDIDAACGQLRQKTLSG